MNSFGRQEGGGFRRREGKLVSPVRRDYPLHLQTDRGEKEGEETRRKRERNPPPKVPPPESYDKRKRRKRLTKRKRGRVGRAGEKKDVNERKK